MNWHDNKTIAEIIHEYGAVRGDLGEKYARDQLVSIIEGRLAPMEAERLRALSEMTDWRDDAVSLKAERDEARANRDRLAHENAALRQQVADLTATSRVLPCDGDCMEYAEECCSLHGRTPADLWRMLAEQNARVETLAAERDGIRGEHAGGSHMSQAEWSDWSNELALLVPEEYHDDVAQEAIIARALADLVRRAETAERALAAGLALAEQWRGRHDLVMTGDSAAHDLTAALTGPAPQPDEACPTCPAATPGKGCTTAWCADHPTPPTTDAEEAHVTEIEDGFGGYWTTCGAGCDLQVVRPGKVQCNRRSSACPDLPVPGAAGEEG